MNGADALTKTHPGAILLAWRDPVTGEIRAGGCIHADLLGDGELDAVVELFAEVGRQTKSVRVYQDGMGFWDVDSKEFITREEAIARRVEKPSKGSAYIEVVVVEPGGSA
jgi:hypothetical protein